MTDHPMTKRCDDCLYAFQGKDELWECRYHPPMPTFPDKDATYSDNWRRVTADFWCSKYNSRKDQEWLKKYYRPTTMDVHDAPTD